MRPILHATLALIALLPGLALAQTVSGRNYGVRLNLSGEEVSVGSGRHGSDVTAEATVEMGWFNLGPNSLAQLRLDLLNISPSRFSSGFEATEYARSRNSALGWIRLQTSLEGYAGPVLIHDGARNRCNVAFTVGGGANLSSNPVITEPDFIALDVGGALACVDTRDPEHPRGFVLQAGVVGGAVAFTTLGVEPEAGAVLRIDGFLDEDALASLTARWHEHPGATGGEERALTATGQIGFSLANIGDFHLMAGLEGTLGYNRSISAGFPEVGAGLGAGCGTVADGATGCPLGEGFNAEGGLFIRVGDRSVAASTEE